MFEYSSTVKSVPQSRGDGGQFREFGTCSHFDWGRAGDWLDARKDYTCILCNIFAGKRQTD